MLIMERQKMGQAVVMSYVRTFSVVCTPRIAIHYVVQS